MTSKNRTKQRPKRASESPNGFVEVLESRELLSTTAYEGFNYARGSVVAGKTEGSGWAGKWTEYIYNANQQYDRIASGSLGYSNLKVSGNRLVTAGKYDLIDRTPSNEGGVAGTTTWVSYLMRQEGAGNGGGYKLPDYAGLELNDSSGNSIFIGKPKSGNFGDLGIETLSNEAETSTGVGVQFMKTYMVVAGITWGANGKDTVTLYVDPPNLGSVAPATPSAVMTVELKDLSDIAVSAGVNATWGFDEIRVGTSFANVTPTN